MSHSSFIEESEFRGDTVYPVKNELLNKNALRVIDRLRQAGFEAYLVGGCLRDMLTGHVPKDFDVATDARPDEIADLFRNCRLIGRRFRLAHILCGREIIEVATFRARGEVEEENLVEMYRCVDNDYGSLEEDAFRRDFTINALYYSPRERQLRDFTGGMNDLDKGVIRLIGEAKTRYAEDPVRMLRAVRFCAKLGFHMDAATRDNIRPCLSLLHHIPPPRLFDETQKLFMTGCAEKSLNLLIKYGLFAELFPQIGEVLTRKDTLTDYALKMMKMATRNTDERYRNEKPVSIGFILAVFLWPCFQIEYQNFVQKNVHWHSAMHQAVDSVILKALQRVSIPMRFRVLIRDIWTLQARFELAQSPKRARNFLKHRTFRAAFDFLWLRMLCGEPVRDMYEWWDDAQARYMDGESIPSRRRTIGNKKRKYRL